MVDSPKLFWEWGTAYDMFVSLEVLHYPKKYAVKSAWASSVRKRLSTEEREILEISLELFHIPFHWIHALPDPKDAITALSSLGQIPAEKRLHRLTMFDDACETDQILREVSERGSWNKDDQDRLQNAFGGDEEKPSVNPDKLATILDWWSRSAEFGERYLNALKTYQEVFFSEEEKRIKPILEKATQRGQALSEELDLADLLEELSHGLRFTEVPEMDELILAPSFWVTPLMYFGQTGPNRGVWLFGARPANESLVPGEGVPETLVRALKAMSDPTRLRILHYLTQESLSPAELARRLRLRAPTVTHHLQALRLAGLVRVTLGSSYGKEKKSFAARSESIKSVCEDLITYLDEGMPSDMIESGD